MNALRIGLVLVVALAAAVVANFVLLGVATGPKDPVGRLSPRAGLVTVPPATSTAPTVPAPTTPSPGTTTTKPRDGSGSEGPDD